MIPYAKSFLGLGLIFRVNGSPLYRACIPGLISVVVYLLICRYAPAPKNDLEHTYIKHPYGVGVLITSVSFLIVFRANYGYQRYWNAVGDVHQMMSKWLDAVCHTGVYHMQQKHHDHFKPPSYFDHHDLNQYNFRRDREREADMTRPTSSEQRTFHKLRSKTKSINHVDESASYESDEVSIRLLEKHKAAIKDPTYVLSTGRKDGGWSKRFQDDGRGTYYDMTDPSSWARGADKGFASTAGGSTPNLFLQELTHLTSLLVAVAFSTLRCDIEGAEAPLDMYKAGQPWPDVDPDQIKKKQGARGRLSVLKDTLLYLSGNDRTPAMRTAHNASRPLPVIGGVSDNEIAFLQRARGPSAKVTLCWHWLSEFIIREHLAGSLGKVGPPIISRIIQFLSDGMIYYNHARKTMFIPFPFPHAQISAFFVFTIIFAVPLLMDEFAEESFVGSILTFATVVCLAGLHEVARELENPFRNVPNEIPLVTLLAMFNESLIVLYSGFHPDHFWEPDEYRDFGEDRKAKDGDILFTETNSFEGLSSPISDASLSPISREKTPLTVNGGGRGRGRRSKSKNGDAPQSTKVPRSTKEGKENTPATIPDLQALVEQQQYELNRLQKMVFRMEEISKSREASPSQANS